MHRCVIYLFFLTLLLFVSTGRNIYKEPAMSVCTMARKKKDVSEELAEVIESRDEDDYSIADYKDDFTDKSFEEEDDEEDVSVDPKAYDQGYEF